MIAKGTWRKVICTVFCDNDKQFRCGLLDEINIKEANEVLV